VHLCSEREEVVRQLPVFRAYLLVEVVAKETAAVGSVCLPDQPAAIGLTP
jgi:hypothetical protein